MVWYCGGSDSDGVCAVFVGLLLEFIRQGLGLHSNKLCDTIVVEQSLNATLQACRRA